MENLCTILVNTCDKYEDCWNPFFTLLKKYWKNIKYPIVLNTESKSFNFPGLDIKSFGMYKDNKKVAWGERMIKTLKKIDSKYIIFMLDDFFITDYVDEDKLNEVIKWMKEDSNIAVFSFNVVEDNKLDIPSNKYYGYALRDKKGPYRFNCQAAIWRRDVLIKIFRKHESPWEWELIGNSRSVRFKEEFYTLVDVKNMIFKYDYKNIGIVRGRWKLPDVKIFFEKEGINIDYDIRNKNIIDIKPSMRIIDRIIRKIKYYITRVRSAI